MKISTAIPSVKGIRSAIDKDEYSLALKLIASAERDDTPRSVLLSMRALCYFQMGSRDDARKACDDAAKALNGKFSGYACNIIADLYSDMGLHAKCKQFLQSSLSAAGDDSEKEVVCRKMICLCHCRDLNFVEQQRESMKLFKQQQRPE